MSKKKGYANDEEARSTKELLTYDAVFARREFEALIKQSDLPGLIAERFCKNQYVGEGSEDATRLAKEYLSANLSEAMYIITSLSLLKAHYYVTGERLPKPRVKIWNAEALRQIYDRDITQLLRDGRGPRLKWNAEELLKRVQWAMRKNKNPKALTLKYVAAAMSRAYPDVRLTDGSLGRLLARKGINWKDLKDSRVKEIKKRT